MSHKLKIFKYLTKIIIKLFLICIMSFLIIKHLFPNLQINKFMTMNYTKLITFNCIKFPIIYLIILLYNYEISI